MGSQYIHDDEGKVIGIITVADTYEFGGFKFEYNNFLGPTKINKDWSQAAKAGRKFYSVISAWEKLSKEEKEKTRI